MKTYSKRTKLLKELITKPSYPVQEGLSLLKKLGNAKFIESRNS